MPIDQQYTLNSLFPDRLVNDEEVNISDVTITARTAKVRAFDAPPATIARDTFSRKKVKPLPVSVMLNQGEVDKRRLAVAQARGGSDASLIEAIYDDATTATKAVQRRVELMRGDLLADGKVTISNENGVTTEADFSVPAGNIATASTLWSDPAAPILDNLRTWSKAYRDLNGFAPGGIVMSEDSWYLMAANDQIRGLYLGANGNAATIVNEGQVDAALRAFRLPPIRLMYDAQTDVDGTLTRILPANKIFFVPPAGVELGFTAWALTVTGVQAAQAGQLTFGTAAGMVGVMDVNSAPPYQEAVYVDSCPLPVLSNPRALAIFTVA
ncbi:hypothetical protein J2S57_000970 [Kineosporia succinea]|uniref:Major capsid protein E n=1 Tax=Kineosporia succinea TaxID=84632 RepID=A0ABT9NXS3_9ACTN|nr:hypothetical protein [Kineosporia succinea]